jgi:adenylate cyclase
MTAPPRPRAAGPLTRFLAIGQRPDDDPDLRVRKRTALVTVFAIIPVGAFYLVLGLLTDRIDMSLFAVLQITALLAAVVYFWRSGRLGPLVTMMLGVGLLTVASGVVSLGGVLQGNGNTIWAVLIPIGAVLFFGRQAGPLAFVAVVMLVVVAAVSDPTLRQRTSPISEDLALPLYVLNILGPTAVALGLVAFIDGERVRAKGQAESLLLNVLPRSIVERLHAGERVIADHCPDVTVLFSDVVDFTPFAEQQPPDRVVAVLNELFTAFDALAAERGLEKIKTIGDAYMVVAGVPDPRPDHAQVMIDMALAMHAAADARPPMDGRRLRLRTGIATGPVVAGVIGRQKFSYDLWGDTVNTASRMESSGVPGCIQVTPATWEGCRAKYPWQARDGVEVKGKGPMRTYVLDPSMVTGPALPSAP